MDWAIYGGVGSIATSLGLALNNPGLAEITTTLLDPNVRFAIVTLICAIFAISSIVSPKWTRRWISLTAIIGIIAGLTAGLSLLFASHEAFVSNWNNHFGSYLTYDQVISTAESGGYAYVPIGLGTFGALFGLIAATYEMNIGYEASTAFAGEIKSARRSIPFATLGCLYIGAVILFLMAWGQGNIIGQKFVYSSMYLFNARPDLWTVPAAADPFLYAVMATGLNPVLAVIIPLALLISPLGLIPIAYYTNSRNLLAFSFDRWLPGTLSKVSKKYHTPWVAILFTFVLYEIGAAFSAYYAAGVIYLSLPMRSLMLLWISVSAIAALIFPLVRKDLYERSDLVKKNRGKLALSSIVAAGFFLFACVYVLIHPEYGGPPNLMTWILVIGLIISGPIIWQIARIYWARKGLDISLVYKEIPPE
jgi:amino acid transporter